MTFINKTYLQITLDNEEKEFIKERADELGYKSVSAFLIDSAKNHFKVEIDMSIYSELTKEINYSG